MMVEDTVGKNYQRTTTKTLFFLFIFSQTARISSGSTPSSKGGTYTPIRFRRPRKLASRLRSELYKYSMTVTRNSRNCCQLVCFGGWWTVDNAVVIVVVPSPSSTNNLRSQARLQYLCTRYHTTYYTSTRTYGELKKS